MKPLKNLVELAERAVKEHASREIFGTKTASGWSWVTYQQFGALVADLRAGLASLGVNAHDRVAFIGDNSVEWAAAAYASYGVGAAFVPMYQAQRPSDWKFILGDCEARVVFVTNDASYDAVIQMQASLPKLAYVIGISRPRGTTGSFADLVAAGAAHPVPPASPDPQSVAAFIYTSGTTGRPKGALLSHRNICSNIEAVHEIFELSPKDRYLSFLPWAHAYGQTVELHMLLSYGASLAFNDELPKLLDNLAEVKPTVLVAVPRIFNRIYDMVTREIASRPGFLQKIIEGGLQGAIKRSRGEPLGPLERVELAFDDFAVFQKIRDKFGGNLRYVFSGSATLSKKVAEFIDALGISVYEGYGLTETSPIATSNSPLGRRFGSVGRALPGVRVEIDHSVTNDPKEGEIVVYGPNVMLGYHDRPAETKAAIGEDGGLRTGDLGYLDEEGYLYISGRIKEQYKLENGKYVMPSLLEEALKLSPFIANVMIHGDGRPFNIALVVPSELALAAWAKKEGFTLAEDPTTDERVRAVIRSEIERLSVDFKGYEKVREIALIREDFTTANGLLTPTLKLKRREVIGRHGQLVDELYKRAAERPPEPIAPPPRDEVRP